MLDEGKVNFSIKEELGGTANVDRGISLGIVFLVKKEKEARSSTVGLSFGSPTKALDIKTFAYFDKEIYSGKE